MCNNVSVKVSDKWAFIVPVILVVAVLLLNLSPQFRAGDLRIYDQLLGLRPAVEEDDRFLMLAVDDRSIESVGGWPWSRDILANAMLTLEEYGVDRILYDIEYIDESPRGIDRQLLDEELPSEFDEAFAAVGQNALDLIEAVAAGQIAPEEAVDFADDLMMLTDRERDALLETVQDVARDHDQYMGRAAEVVGSVFYTNNVLNLPNHIAPVTEEHLEFARDRFSVADAPEEPHPIQQFARIQPVIPPIVEHAAGAGFTQVVIDPDGVRRRVNLLAEHDGRLFPQLAVSPLLDLLGDPGVEVEDSTVRLVEADHPDYESPQDIEIPLSHDGRLMINWPPGDFGDHFRVESYMAIYNYEAARDDIYDLLLQMEQAGFLQAFAGTSPIEHYEAADTLRREIMTEERSSDEFSSYLAERSGFIESAREFSEGDSREFLEEEIGRALEAAEEPEEQQELEGILEDIAVTFDELDSRLDTYEELSGRLSDAVEDSFVVIGQTGIGTVDIGVTPFSRLYFNLGTHPAVANTILQEDFIVELPRWMSLVAAAFFGLAVGFGTARMDAKKSVIFGIVSFVVVAAAGALLFMLTGRYIGMSSPLLAVGLTFVGSSAHAAIKNSAERAFLRNAFSRYLSADVISQIMEDPSKLALGGEKKYLTAMFTDLEGFSTISEQLDPADLVRLLNEYLTEMSDIILDVHGTIDKYEGDAIIAFFNAPLDDENHAANACEAAIKMKRIETNLNNRFLEQRLTPNPLSTRVGINTGEMVVGNMGTERQMDYTIMGHAVNLAARLEGVNKQYGSAILVSEETRRVAGDRFLFRRLDRVRVVGVHEPVQLYELLDERRAASGELRTRVETFEEAIDAFRAHDFSQAGRLFASIVEEAPNDIPAKRYAERCRKYVENPPPSDWDGVYKLSEK